MADPDALAQISAVMSAPTQAVAVVVLRADGSCDEAKIDHRKVGELLGGTPTVVGALRFLSAQAVSRRGAKGSVNKHALPADSFEPGIKGDIVLLRTDDDSAGTPLDLTVVEYNKWVDDGRPDAEEEEGEEEGEEDEGEESEEGEESGSEDEDGESDEEDEVDLSELPESELRRACKLFGLGEEGSKEALITRLARRSPPRRPLAPRITAIPPLQVAHAKEQVEGESDEESESEGEEEEAGEEEEQEAPAPKRRTTKAASSAAGPSKAPAKRAKRS